MEDKTIKISEEELNKLIAETVEIVANDLSKNSENDVDKKLLVTLIGFAVGTKLMIRVNEYYEKQQQPKCEVIFNENN